MLETNGVGTVEITASAAMKPFGVSTPETLPA